MSELDVEAIRARAEAATPDEGPSSDLAGVPWRGCYFDDYATDADRVFLESVRSDVPALLDEVDRLTAERDRLRDLAAALEADCASTHDALERTVRLHKAGVR